MSSCTEGISGQEHPDNPVVYRDRLGEWKRSYGYRKLMRDWISALLSSEASAVTERKAGRYAAGVVTTQKDFPQAADILHWTVLTSLMRFVAPGDDWCADILYCQTETSTHYTLYLIVNEDPYTYKDIEEPVMGWDTY